jgi:site-specific DNA recombinase
MRPRTAPTRIVGYIRVSTDKQATEGNSLEAQRARLEAYATAMQLEIVAFEVDAGLSAKSLERPGLQRALARLDAFEADAILVVKLDRLTRSVRDLLTLIDTYFRDGQHELLSIGESIDTRSAAGRMIRKILTTHGEWEREAIGERTAAVMQHMKSQGEFTGGWPPFGYRVVDGRLEPDAIEQALIERARAFRSAGMSLRAVAAELGPNNRTGRAFDPKQIARML